MEPSSATSQLPSLSLNVLIYKMGITVLALLKDLEITHIRDMSSLSGLDHGVAVITFALSMTFSQGPAGNMEIV